MQSETTPPSLVEMGGVACQTSAKKSAVLCGGRLNSLWPQSGVIDREGEKSEGEHDKSRIARE